MPLSPLVPHERRAPTGPLPETELEGIGAAI